MKIFRLSGSISMTNMVAFDPEGKIRQYKTAEEIIADFYRIRMGLYTKRKEFMVRALEAQWKVLDNKVRFIRAVIEKTLELRNKKRVDLVDELEKRGFDRFSDIKNPKSNLAALPDNNNEDEEDDEENKEVEIKDAALKRKSIPTRTPPSEYDYLLKLPLWSITREEVIKLEGELKEKTEELERLKATSEIQLYLTDLDAVEAALPIWEAHEERLRYGDKQKKIKLVSAKGERAGTGRGRKPKKGVKEEDEDFEIMRRPVQRKKVVKDEPMKTAPPMPQLKVEQPKPTVPAPSKPEPPVKPKTEAPPSTQGLSLVERFRLKQQTSAKVNENKNTLIESFFSKVEDAPMEQPAPEPPKKPDPPKKAEAPKEEAKKPRAQKPKAKKTKAPKDDWDFIVDDDDEESEEEKPKKRLVKTKAKPAAKPKKSKKDDDDDFEVISDSDEEPPAKKPVETSSGRSMRKRQPVNYSKYTDSDDSFIDDDDDAESMSSSGSSDSD